MYRLACLVLMLSSACATSPRLPTTPPADFAVEYGWSTGSLPPRYHHALRIVVAADGAGTLTGRTAYDSGPTETWAFQLSPADRDALYTRLRDGGFFRSWSADGNPPVGGSSWWAKATADGRSTDLPSFVVRRQAAAKAALEDALREAVPAGVWTTHDAWLAQAQASLSAGG